MCNEGVNKYEYLFKKHINMNKINNWIKYTENSNAPVKIIIFPTTLKKDMIDIVDLDDITTTIEEYITKYLDERYRVFKIKYGLATKKKKTVTLKELNKSKINTVDTLLNDGMDEEDYGYIIEIRKKEIQKNPIMMECEEFKSQYKEGCNRVLGLFLFVVISLIGLVPNLERYIPHIEFMFSGFAGFILIFLYFLSRGVCTFFCDIAMYFCFKTQAKLLNPFRLGSFIGLVSIPLTCLMAEVIVTLGWR